LDAIKSTIPDAREVTLWGRPELEAHTKESAGVGYNEKVYGDCLFVNARARPGEGLLSLASRPGTFSYSLDGSVVIGRLKGTDLKPGVMGRRTSLSLSKKGENLTAESGSLFGGYWDLVEGNGLAIAEQTRRLEDSQSLPSSAEVRGPPSNIQIEGGADVEQQVSFDARLGPITVEKGAVVESFSKVMGPCFIGEKTKVLSAQIGGGTSIFESCKVGGQVENSIVMPHSNKAHLGYVGDSYVGEWVNLGAGCNFSNLKNTYGNVRVESSDGKRIDSGLMKVGPLIGDLCKVSIGALVYAGKMVGTGANLAGLADRSVPSFTFWDGRGKMVELLEDSVIETQRRMMERRGLTLSRAFEGLIRRAFASTAAERKASGVRKGRIK
jgi:UDP-N-acetylglucosamine diphosphorylase / glucose-1-phosphate thymidylyltransferase / UDP-N-acetylgalactosamine diphosphorylase / glucosamine-1-phosphate N-acetyltransferase / galactosamine-1-phosphate N-acetyltransferase